jgi:hypothetical protein
MDERKAHEHRDMRQLPTSTLMRNKGEGYGAVTVCPR